MSAYYDHFRKKTDVGQISDQQPLYGFFIPEGTIEQKEFLDHSHLFPGISRSLLEDAMSTFKNFVSLQ